MKNLKMKQEPLHFSTLCTSATFESRDQHGASSANSGDENSEKSDEYSARSQGLWKDSALPKLLIS